MCPPASHSPRVSVSPCLCQGPLGAGACVGGVRPRCARLPHLEVPEARVAEAGVAEAGVAEAGVAEARTKPCPPTRGHTLFTHFRMAKTRAAMKATKATKAKAHQGQGPDQGAEVRGPVRGPVQLPGHAVHQARGRGDRGQEPGAQVLHQKGCHGDGLHVRAQERRTSFSRSTRRTCGRELVWSWCVERAC